MKPNQDCSSPNQRDTDFLGNKLDMQRAAYQWHTQGFLFPMPRSNPKTKRADRCALRPYVYDMKYIANKSFIAYVQQNHYFEVTVAVSRPLNSMK